MHWIVRLAVFAALLGGITGCSQQQARPYAVGIGKQYNPKTKKFLWYAIQYSQTAPSAVIFWKGDRFSSKVESADDGRITRINGVEVEVEDDGPAVFVFINEELRRLSLDENDADQVLQLTRAQLPTPKTPLFQNELWNQAVGKHLQ